MNNKIITLEVLQTLVSEIHLEALLETLDRLHEGASNGAINQVSAVAPDTLIGWLEDIVFTAQETIGELRREGNSPNTAEPPTQVEIKPLLRVVP